MPFPGIELDSSDGHVNKLQFVDTSATSSVRLGVNFWTFIRYLDVFVRRQMVSIS
jgi:hypothetical protein